jgi:hypothetical protein
MPSWVWILLGIIALAVGVYFFSRKTGTLPSGNTATVAATLNPSGTQYGNLT